MEVFLTVERYCLWMIVYSMIGWVYESIVESIRHKRPINRGFLFGPYIPIYGTGALLDVLLLGRIPNPVLLFFAAAILCCAVEFMISVVLEKIYHRRWWDYNDFKFSFGKLVIDVGKYNLQGRICLAGFLAFGTLSLILVYLIHPLMVYLTGLMPPVVFHAVTGGLFLIFMTDLVITLIVLAGRNRKAKEKPPASQAEE